MSAAEDNDPVKRRDFLTAAAAAALTGCASAQFRVTRATQILPITHSGTGWTTNGMGVLTLNAAPVNAGNLLLFGVSCGGAGIAKSFSSVAGGGVSTWTRVVGYIDTTSDWLLELWMGQVTTAGGAYITVTNSSLTSEWNRYWAQEFTASSASITWGVAASSPASGSGLCLGTGATVRYPSLSATGLYAGVAGSRWGTLQAGTSAGYAYTEVDSHLQTVWNTSASAAPAGADSDSGDDWDTIGAVFTATGIPEPLAVASTSLAPGMTTFAYPYEQVPSSSQLTAVGGTPPYSWSVVSGSLPSGLSMSTSGVITGTPAAAGTSSFTVRVTDSAQATATAALSLTINAAPPIVQTVSYPSVTSSKWTPSGSWTASSSPDPEWKYFPQGTDSRGNATVPPYVNQNLWGPVSGCTQELDVYSLHMWEIKAAFNDSSGAVHTFPNTGMYNYCSWQSFYTSLTSGWDVYMDTDSDIVASACYDIWFDQTVAPGGALNNVNEIMIHFDFRNRGTDSSWFALAVPFGGNTVNGHYITPATYSMAYTPGAATTAAYWNATDAIGNPVNIPSGTVDIKAMMQWCVDHGIIANGSEMTGFSIGFEICNTSGNIKVFRYNDCWADAQLA